MKTIIDENALVNRLRVLIENKSMREYMGNKGKERWYSLFRWKVVSNQYTIALTSAASSTEEGGGFPSFAGPVGDRP